MKYIGDITQLSGKDIEPVDVVIGGSPCQDLSIAGNREGLAGVRSGLYMEQIRIIKELRWADEQRGRTGHMVRPRFMVWENVPGAFSSNGGADFAAVIAEAVRVIKPQAPTVPVPDRGWPTSGCLYDELGRWSLAWRVLDAQFWGVPQRRRRIALVVDFGGQAAPEILFVRKGMCGDIDQGETAGETAAVGTGGGAVGAVSMRIRGGCEGGGKGALIQVEKSGTLTAANDQTLFCAGFKHKQGAKAGNIGFAVETAPTLSAEQVSTVFENHGQDSRLTGPLDVAPTVAQKFGTRGNNTPLVLSQQRFGEYREGIATLTAHNGTRHTGETLVVGSTVRRLTPLECERLQGFPDGWTDIGAWVDSKGKVHKESSDSARYKALGNSIALPPWRWVLLRLCGCYERPATLGSLFDGIGGFPLIWERLNGPGTALWASEIEEFPIAVTRVRFAR